MPPPPFRQVAPRFSNQKINRRGRLFSRYACPPFPLELLSPGFDSDSVSISSSGSSI